MLADAIVTSKSYSRYDTEQLNDVPDDFLDNIKPRQGQDPKEKYEHPLLESHRYVKENIEKLEKTT